MKIKQHYTPQNSEILKRSNVYLLTCLPAKSLHSVPGINREKYKHERLLCMSKIEPVLSFPN